MAEQPVQILVYRWGGAWGPFKVKIPCGECTLTTDVITDTLETDLADIPTSLEIKDWLSHWWEPLLTGGIHAPIVMVDGKIIAQGGALNRGLLTEAVIDAHAKRSSLSGTHVFGKESCPHCVRAKATLEEKGVPFKYHDVVRQPRALYDMLARVKPIIGPKTPVTVPQIWIDGKYIGGAEQLAEVM